MRPSACIWFPWPNVVGDCVARYAYTRTLLGIYHAMIVTMSSVAVKCSHLEGGDWSLWAKFMDKVLKCICKQLHYWLKRLQKRKEMKTNMRSTNKMVYFVRGLWHYVSILSTKLSISIRDTTRFKISEFWTWIHLLHYFQSYYREITSNPPSEWGISYIKKMIRPQLRN